MLVFGAGPMGALIAQAVSMAGAAQVDISDVIPWRLAVMEELGVTHAVLADDLPKNAKIFAPQGYDVVVDATGVPSVIEQSFNYARPRRKVWIFGVAPDKALAQFSPYQVFRKDLSIIGSFAVNRTFPESIMMIRSGKIHLDSLVSHQLPLEDFQEGFRLAQEDPRRMKVQYVF